MISQTNPMDQSVITLPDSLTFSNSAEWQEKFEKILKDQSIRLISIDLQNVVAMDSSGAALIHYLKKAAARTNREVELLNCSPRLEQTLDLFRLKKETAADSRPKKNFFERLGNSIYTFLQSLAEVVILMANVSYWSVAGFFKPRIRRRGEIIHQSILIGVNALPIIALIAFLIGFILALQSAVQLRQFGANIYVADLVAVAMVSEMGPLITAIMVAGRSGSAIAAEFATMSVTEELDALRVMGIDPIPYLVVPKMFSITITLPMLTIFANLIGIIGGMIIALTYLDIQPVAFYNEVVSVLRYKELYVALIKSLAFAGIIVLTGTFYGFRVRGGSEEVGRATTASVVTSIFLVIVADSIIGLMFYFGEPAF